MEVTQKWGFGMAPLKSDTEYSYRKAIVAVKRFVSGDDSAIRSDITDHISTVKGLFNRIIKQNQWDWFTVNMYMDFPQQKDIAAIVTALSSLRRAILNTDDTEGKKALDTLVRSHFLTYCENFLSFDINSETPEDYLYILSRREEQEILKIGMTTRNVQKRVNEINSATGVVFPFSARQVYKVKDARIAEKDVHTLLAEYRIRSDREFFRISYKTACSIIENYLTQNDQWFYSE